MKNLKRMIAIVTMVALLLLAAMTCAMADEKIYTSPVFKLPKDKIQQWMETLPDENAPEEPAQETPAPAEGEEPPAQPAESEEPAVQPAEGEEPAAAPAEGVETTTAPAEGEEVAATPAEGEEPAAEPTEGEAAAEPDGQEAPAEPAEPERKVSIFSSQGDVVTEGEIIYLTSVLEGFDGLEVTFQWQVDRDDGNGWVDVEGATRDRHMFVASKETIRYSWRLVVNVNE